MSQPNAEMRSYWNEQGGPTWVAMQERMDAQIGAHGALGLALLAAQPGERVLDVGCGCGDTSLAIARAVAPGGRVLGVDISAPMLARARERAAAAGLANLAFELADAQLHAFPPAAFDALFSRFGVMFFDAPSTAFANLGRALRPSARLAFVCWQAPQANPWVAVPMAALAGLVPMPAPPPPGAPGPFAFADPAHVRKLLEEAGFRDVGFHGERLPMSFGAIGEAAAFLTEIGPAARAIREADPSGDLRGRVEAAFRAALAPHQKEGRVALESAVWLVSARWPG
jgi:SAM-dependent methyltransferase